MKQFTWSVIYKITIILKAKHKPKKKGPHFFWLVSGLRVPDAHFKGSNLGDLISSFQGCDG